ncbi:hypothetical protein [Kitasatospora sp. NPDC088783]|uniref:hypothetical protein n=1 Tax=Kitasatospora sp. NPDC088783 TaxID=3364077 RepID=UPI0037F91577
MIAALAIGASSAGCSSSKTESSGASNSAPAATTSSAATSTSSTAVAASSSAAAATTEAASLKAFVASSSSATSAMKTAVADHVAKVDASDGQVNIYTDLTGDITSSDTGTAKLIVSAATDWATQKHKPIAAGAGLITVYNQSGTILSNGNY